MMIQYLRRLRRQRQTDADATILNAESDMMKIKHCLFQYLKIEHKLPQTFSDFKLRCIYFVETIYIIFAYEH